MSNPEKSGWLEITIKIEPIAHEAVTAFLFDLGCEGVISEDFHDQSLRAYLPFSENSEDIQNRIHVFLRNLRRIFRELPFS